VFARGVGNSMGLDWNPATNELWFIDNGRDGMRDDVPPDELNFPPQSRMNFGFPYCHGGNIPDPVFGQKHPCTEFVAPAMGLPAHVASLGMCFYEGNMFPTAYKNQVFIAEHGSWDRSVSTGYHIRLVHVEGNHASNYEVFAEGWRIGRFKWGWSAARFRRLCWSGLPDHLSEPMKRREGRSV
jgi:glucose/arabinose dehydrogenase